MKEWFKRLFKRAVPEGRGVVSSTEPKVAKDLQIRDDVFVIINNTLYKGWITGKSRRLLQVHVWKLDEEFIIPYKGKEDKSVIPYGGSNYLILNKKDICDYLSS